MSDMRTSHPPGVAPRHGWHARVGLHPIALIAVGAVTLRFLLFLGRGDYVTYDEAWYLLLGRNLLSGDGYTLSGLRHLALSPLFPILAGALDHLLGDPIWAGRIVAAIASGLVVVPCWSIFRRLAGRRTALLGCGIVAVLPSLAPFVAPYWVGWDMFVGAEPLLHLLLYTGIAFFLRAMQHGRTRDWAFAGAAFALAYLARPEAVLVFGLLGLATTASLLARRLPRALPAAMVGAVVFSLVALPYWVYLHDATGRWTVTGRGVSIELPGAARRAGDGRLSSDATIERMLWRGEHGRYVRRLYALAPSGTRLSSSYWGVPLRGEAPDSRAAGEPAASEGPEIGGGARDEAASGEAVPSEQPPAAATDDVAGGAATPPPAPAPHGLVLYARSLEMVLPWFLLPFLAVGALAPGRTRRWRLELPVAGTLVVASALIAAVVAVDPRTQAFLAPLLAFYTARGLRLAGVAVDRSIGGKAIRRGFAGVLVASTALVVLLGIDARRLYMATTVGSLHQLGASENRRAGEVLREIVPEGEPVVSWHPAIALHARRDWRVLPIGGFSEILRYARAIDSEYVVLSYYNPSPLDDEQFPRPYLLVRVAPEAPRADRWTIEVVEMRENVAVGRLVPS